MIEFTPKELEYLASHHLIRPTGAESAVKQTTVLFKFNPDRGTFSFAGVDVDEVDERRS